VELSVEVELFREARTLLPALAHLRAQTLALDHLRALPLALDHLRALPLALAHLRALPLDYLVFWITHLIILPRPSCSPSSPLNQI
jgi:hypothetical protein